MSLITLAAFGLVLLLTASSRWHSVEVKGTVATSVPPATSAHRPTSTVAVRPATTLKRRPVKHARRRPKPKAPATTPAPTLPPATLPPAPPPTAPPVTAPPVTAPPPPPPPPPPPAVAGVAANSMESSFLSLLNATRAAHGLAPLGWDGGLAGIARNWSVTMSTTGLHHNPDLTGALTAADPGWGLGGENVGEGPTVAALNTAFINSPEHYANIVNPGYTRVGIGVVVVNGTIWVTFDFVRI